jgi:hypothetical protein
MNEKQNIEINTGSKSYMLMVSEFIGTKTLKHLFSAELRGEAGSTYFLMGVPNPALLYATSHDITPEGITKFLFDAIRESVAEFLEENAWEGGKTYYGELMEDGKFRIGSEKPSWEDGNWGQLMK